VVGGEAQEQDHGGAHFFAAVAPSLEEVARAELQHLKRSQEMGRRKATTCAKGKECIRLCSRVSHGGMLSTCTPYPQQAWRVACVMSSTHAHIDPDESLTG